ncbi:MAG: hypothetical protein EOM59_13250 [Clostridia bacterium]|nr:hypothetical protein [Clostridia bacterium]
MLFKPTDIGQDTVKDKQTSDMLQQSAGLNRVFLSENYKQLNESLQTIKEGYTYHLVSLGHWSMHHLLFHLLKMTGPATIYATTWSISEDVVRHLVEAKKQGLIKDMTFIYDYRVRKYKPAAYFLSQEYFTSIVTSCHAKVTIIESETHQLTIVGSANYTRNDRIEVGVIFTDKATHDFHKNWITHEIEHANENL